MSRVRSSPSSPQSWWRCSPSARPPRAHPLGNFSINHLVEVRISTHRVDLHYILDQAEIPTFQERGLSAAAVLD